MTKLPTNAPRRLPVPPRITTMSESGSMSLSSRGETERIGAPMIPPKPASPAPSEKTTEKSRGTGIPTTRAIAGSSTPARIIAPKRVRSIITQRAIATKTAMRTTTSRYVGKGAPKTAVKPLRAGGVLTEIGSPPHPNRHESATMSDKPRVISTCARACPESLRSRSRSIPNPIAAKTIAATTAANQKRKPKRRKVTPRYAPSMKNEPCIRFGMRIKPKISERPQASKNKRPPIAILLIVRTSHRFIFRLAVLSEDRRIRVARIGRRCEILLRIEGPKLADVGISFDDRVDEFTVHPIDAPDEDVSYDVAVFVEVKRPPGRIRERDRTQRLDERGLVVDSASRLLQRLLDAHSVDVIGRGVESRDVVVRALHRSHEAFVAR